HTRCYRDWSSDVCSSDLPIAPAVRVTVQDSTGQPDGNFNGPVTVALAANPVGATLSGGLDVNAVSGVATFSDLKVNKVGRGYTRSEERRVGEGVEERLEW